MESINRINKVSQGCAFAELTKHLGLGDVLATFGEAGPVQTPRLCSRRRDALGDVEVAELFDDERCGSSASPLGAGGVAQPNLGDEHGQEGPHVAADV